MVTEMDFHSPSTLAYSSAVAVTATLYCHENFEYLLEEGNLTSSWQGTRDKILTNIPLLPLPEAVKMDIEYLVLPIGEQIKAFLVKHPYILKGRASLYGKFSWTPLALINSKRTAINILDEGCLDDITAFHLAGVHCLEENVRQMWPSLTAHFTNVAPEGSDYLQFKSINGTVHSSLIPKWVLHMIYPGNDAEQQYGFVENVFQQAVKLGNAEAASYFFKKVQPSRRNELLKMSTWLCLFPGEPMLLIFLLSQVAEEYEKDIISYSILWFLNAFLQWPFYKFFIPLCERMWDLIPDQEVSRMAFAALSVRIELEKDAILYKNLFIEFWLKCPVEGKNKSITQFFVTKVSPVFGPFNHEEALEILCDDPNASDKLKSYLFANPDRMMELIIEVNKSNAVKALLQYCFPSLTEKDGFEQMYFRFTDRLPTLVLP